jgi:ABC-2 type transport system permease protein
MTTNSALQTLNENGWRIGFTNFLRKENQEWWGGRRWLTQAILWILILGGFLALPLFVAPASAPPGEEVAVSTTEAAQVYFQVAGLALAIALIIRAQGTIIGEKQSGTAAWMLSKPLSRPAFLLAKLFAFILGIVVLQVVLPGAVAYVEIWIATGISLPVLTFLGGLGLLLISQVFYLTLILMLGTLYDRRGPVMAIAFVILFGGSIIPNMLPQSNLVTPWPLPQIAGGMAAGTPLPATAWYPAIATLLWSAIFIWIAVIRFQQEDF